MIQPDGRKPCSKQIDSEDEAIHRAESQIRAVDIARYRHSFRRINKQVVELARRADEIASGVHQEAEDKDCDEEDERMNVIRDESRSQTSRDDIGSHDEWYEEASGVNIYSRDGGDDLRPAQDEACADEQVCCQAIEQVSDVSNLAMSG